MVPCMRAVSSHRVQGSHRSWKSGVLADLSEQAVDSVFCGTAAYESGPWGKY